MNYRHLNHGSASISWYLRRARRILLPFYFVAVPLLLMAYGFEAIADGHAGISGKLATKMAAMIPDTWPIALSKHLLLVDPRQRHWTVDFFAPSWWFIPAIIVAYLSFPLLCRIRLWIGSTTLLVGSLCVSVASYALSERGFLVENAWYFVITHELFTFVLGIELGACMQIDKCAEPRIVSFACLPTSFCLGLFLFLLGNFCNWFPATYPVSSPLFTVGFVLILAFLAIHLTRWKPIVAVAIRTDTYYIYLLHQPFAFPLAVLSGVAAGRAATAVGGFIYLLTIFAIVLTFGFIIRWFLANPPLQVTLAQPIISLIKSSQKDRIVKRQLD